MLRRFWNHQFEMYKYTATQHPALFAEMRLGKSIVTLRRCRTYHPRNEHRRILIVAPNSALPDWHVELGEEGQTGIHLLLGERSDREGLLRDAFKAPRHTWCLLNREGHRALPGVGEMPWDAVVLDESTCIKTPPTRKKAKISKFYHTNFRDVPHRWILTGNPAPESELNYYSQFRFQHNRPFGQKNYWEFRNAFFSSDPWGHNFWLRPGKKRIFQEWLAANSFVLRRKDVGMEGEKVYERRWFRLPRALEKATRELEDNFTLEYKGQEVTDFKHSGAVFQKLRELAQGYFGSEVVWTGKLKGIVELCLGELRNESVVVWFQYNQLIEPLVDLLSVANIDCRVVRGETKYATRSKTFNDFNKGKYQVLLIQAQCGEFGANLSSGGAGIYLDGITSGEMRGQTEDRIVHMEKAGPSLIIDMLTEDTVDEDVYKLITRKKVKSVRLMDVVREIQIRRNRREIASITY